MADGYFFVAGCYVFLCGDSMNFSTYQREFIAEARKHDKNDEYIEKCLAYAKNLVDKRLPIIYDEKHFSQLVGIDLDYLLSAANSPKHFYRYFTIPKRNGKIRKISEPLPVLKEAQYYILNNILKTVPCSIYAKAYKPGATLKGNAKFHRKQPVLVKLDLKDYFPSLHESRVFQLFHQSFGYGKSVSILMSKLCTLDGGLPQGAPTSPYLSNLLTSEMDDKIYQFCSSNGNLRYTRYADDISISGSMNPSDIISGVSRIVSEHHLQINKSKTAVIRPHKRQVVTGVVVNNKIQASKDYRRSIRLEMHYCMKYGIESHISRATKRSSDAVDRVKFCQSMLGKINYCLQLNGKDTEMQRYRDYMLEQLHGNAQ